MGGTETQRERKEGREEADAGARQRSAVLDT